MKIIAVIPARYKSTRFLGKPLANICGKPMIWWVYNCISSIAAIDEIYVATDDKRIYDAVIAFSGNAIMTGEFDSGTDRVSFVCKNIDFDVVLNIQGDEPMIKTEMIVDLISAFNDPNVKMATLKKEIYDNNILDCNIAKVITDLNGDAIYFSRSVIPFNRDKLGNAKYYKHIGVYGYTKDFIDIFPRLPKSQLEETEKLEQLRVLESGYKIRVIETKYQSIGVDLPEHIELVESEIRKEKGDYYE